jgi:hypothetical protein
MTGFTICSTSCLTDIYNKNTDTMDNDLTTLLEIDDRVIAEDIQVLLEDSQIYSLLVSDNPASSVLNVYSGFSPAESISIQVNKNDYPKAVEIINNSAYKELLTNV